MAAGYSYFTTLAADGTTTQKVRTYSPDTSDATAINRAAPYIGDGEDVAFGAQADAVASSDTGTFSFIALFKRLLQSTTSLIAKFTLGAGTAAAALRVELPTDGTGKVGLNAGTNAIGKLAANAGVVIGDVQSVGLIPGTAKTWKASGGDYAITLTSLASGSAREGVKGDFYDATYGLPVMLGIRFESSANVAVTAGTEVQLFFGFSENSGAGSDNPGNLTGADAALSNPTELTGQLTFAGSIVMSNARTTSVQKQRFYAVPLARYLIPLVYQATGQALGSTAADHQIVVTPYYRKA